ncbi:MAG: lamin tail domain-containing protein [Chitinispirillaceae bacterium]|nr:lamin tail domain-containing protein [Chitinispirillaceae bacterium]
MLRHTTIRKITQRYDAFFLLVALVTGCIDGPAKPGELNPDLLDLRLTEIHYHPLELDGYIDDSLEFIEIKNTGSATLDIGSLRFTGGVDYSFPSGARLAPDDFYVIASSAKAFEQRYGFSPDGVYSGQLKNSGETIELKDAASLEAIFSQTYSDSGKWPGSADGDGYSLVPVNQNPGRNETGSDFWRASTRIHGSPGADDELKAVDSSLFDLRITEINYHPDYPDTAGEDSLEFIELKNAGVKTLDLSGVAIVSGVDYKFAAGVTLEPGALIVLASSPTWFRERYGFDPFDHYDGQLKNSSETITVRDRKAAVDLISITYGDGNPWPNEPDGEGRTLVPIHANPAREEQDDPAAWRASFRIHGSPGEDDPEAVLVNEILSHTDEPQVDAIELYNPNKADIDLGGWYLSDDETNPIKFRIPDGTNIKAEDYLVFTANDFNKDTTFSSFGLGENGDDAVLSSDTTGCMGYCHGFSFGALERGISFGRYIVPSTGNEVFVPLANVTLGEPNSAPLVGPLVISEIMYQAGDGSADYLEITNIGNQEVPLYDRQNPDNTWRIQIDDLFYSFPGEKSVKSGESVVVICGSTDTGDFRSGYGIAAAVQLFTFNNSLPDISAKVELEKPMEPEKDSTGALIPTETAYMEYDKISYKDQSPWPAGAKGTGSSLTRIENDTFGNDPANWAAASPTPGKVE